MNSSTFSAECLHRMCSQCDYEDCVCACHLHELLDCADEPEESTNA